MPESNDGLVASAVAQQRHRDGQMMLAEVKGGQCPQVHRDQHVGPVLSTELMRSGTHVMGCHWRSRTAQSQQQQHAVMGRGRQTACLGSEADVGCMPSCEHMHGRAPSPQHVLRRSLSVAARFFTILQSGMLPSQWEHAGNKVRWCCLLDP